MTLEIAREFTRDLDSLSHAKNIKLFLIDVREAPNTSSVFQNYNFAYQDMKDLNLQRDVRSAILTSPTDSTHDFVEMVTQNAGYNVQIFHDENAAIAWLNEETDG
jgi:hypothetical protein